jgi:hypothetical protein
MTIDGASPDDGRGPVREPGTASVACTLAVLGEGQRCEDRREMPAPPVEGEA